MAETMSQRMKRIRNEANAKNKMRADKEKGAARKKAKQMSADTKLAQKKKTPVKSAIKKKTIREGIVSRNQALCVAAGTCKAQGASGTVNGKVIE